MKKLLFTVLITVMILVTNKASAVTTKIWKCSELKDFKDGKLNGVSISSKGKIRLGLRLKKFNEGKVLFYSSVVDNDGTVYLGSYFDGKIYKFSDGKLKIFAETKELLITSLALDSNKNIFAATFPGSRVYKFSPQGKIIWVKKIPESFVWSITTDYQDNVIAGTGPNGKLYKIFPSGNYSQLYKCSEKNIICVKENADKEIYFGTAEGAILYKIKRNGTVKVVQQFEEDEIRSICFVNKSCYVGLNEAKKGSGGILAEVLKIAKKKEIKVDEKKLPPDRLSKGIVYKVSNDDSVKGVLSFGKGFITSLAPGKNSIFCSLGNSSIVFQCLPSEDEYRYVCKVGEKGVLTLASYDKKLKFAGTTKSGTFYSVSKASSEEAEYISPLKSTTFTATWGMISWRGKGKFCVQVRTGNSKKPDTTWSAWSEKFVKSPSKIINPQAKYIQFKINWQKDADAILSAVNIAYLVKNQKPIVRNVSVKGGKDKKSSKGDEHSTVKEIKWKGFDVDKDKLIFRLWYKEVGQKNWIKINADKLITKTNFKWQTESIPDGRYLLKVEASDELSNPPKDRLKSSSISHSFIIDNTKPTIKNLIIDVKQLCCTGVAKDTTSIIKKIEYCIDGKNWIQIHPVDKVLDEKTEKFKIDIGKIISGMHSIAIRVYDEEDNVVIKQIAFNVE